MRDEKIREWVASLVSSIGEPRPPASAEELERCYMQQDFSGMLSCIRKKLGLTMRLRLGLVNSGGPKNHRGLPAPAWVERVTRTPIFGTAEFARFQVTVFIRKEYLRGSPFGVAVIAMAHELCHVVLDSIGHPLRNQEEAVDLTAMLLGYRNFYAKFASQEVSREIDWEGFVSAVMAGEKNPDLVEKIMTARHGYLSPEEIRYALVLMRT